MIYGKWISGKDDLSDALAVRKAVFVDEQGYDAAQDVDAFDARAIHAVLYDEEKRPVGTGRLFIDDDGYWRIGRVCILSSMRGMQLGDLLMRMVLDKALSVGAKHFRLGAQTDKLGFYERYGFAAYGDEYLEEGNPHMAMEADYDSVMQKVFGGCHT